MLDLKHIVVATDLSPLSLCAVRYGCQLAKQFNAHLDLLNVVSHPFSQFAMECRTDFEASFEDCERECREAAETALSEVSIDPLTDDSNITRIVLMGTPISEILQYAKQKNADLLIAGTHGHSGLTHVLMGSVAERIVRHAPCPVLTIRDPQHRFSSVNSHAS